MSMDKIQLKQEDIINDNVVLTDINPITNTPSIVDASNGETMDATMLRVWEAINNKISRVVNSVNGRTGVVVLTSDDVGLGNVDNVSFSDIKSWVIEQIQNAFKNKKMRFYDTFADAENAMRSNDKMLAWAPFYCERYDDFDKRCVIGVFGWNPETSTLNIDAYRKLNTIGEADETIIYRMSSSDYPQEPLPDDRRIPVGGIGVNIYQEPNPDDQILFVEGVGRNDKSLSGLRVHNEKLGSHMYYESSPYGAQTGRYAYSRDVEHGMLWTTTMSESDKDSRCVKICVNGSEITPEYTTTTTSTDPSTLAPDGYFHFNKNWEYVNRLKANDLILMQFDDLAEPIGRDKRNQTIAGICLELSGRQMALGIVSQEVIDSETVIVINFHTLRRTLNGYGIRELESHVDGTVHDVQLGLDAFQTTSIEHKNILFPVNMSGINAHADKGTRGSATDVYKEHGTKINTPWGYSIFPSSGMHIETDASMCIYPEYQSLPTQHTPRKVIPQFVPGKYYEREANDYVVLSSEPTKWEIEYYKYYYYDETSQTYKPVPGIDLLYSPLNPTTQVGSSVYQYCTGSIFGRNASYREPPTVESGGYNIPTNYTPSDDDNILSPEGSDPKDGLLGTHSCLSLNFRKLSSSWTYHNMDEYTTDNGACKTLYDISGLRLTPFKSIHGSIAYVGELMRHNFDQETLFDIGIYDNKDANGNDVSEILFGGITHGISINVGKFLEIAPKEVFRAEKYTESGKVQVRVGQGLTDETEWIDLTDLIKANNPGSAEWKNRTGLDYAEVCRRWMTHPEEFYITNTDDFTDPEIHPERNIVRYDQVNTAPSWESVAGNVYEKNQNDTYSPVTEKPADWDLTYGYYYWDPAGTGGEYYPMHAEVSSNYYDEWYKYYMFNIGTYDTPDYVFLPYRDGEAPSPRPVDESYMGPYYTYKRYPFYQWTDGDKVKHGTFDEIKRYFETLDPASYENLYYIFWKKPHNRITVDIDPETLAFNEKNQLTVIGGSGGGDESKGANVRIIDNRGVFFDTVPDKPIDEIVKLGDGLKVSGSSVSIPADVKLSYDSYRALLQDILANMSSIEIAYYAVTDASKVGLGNPYSFVLGSIPQWESTLDNIIQQLPAQYDGVTYTCAMCEQGFSNAGDKLNQLLGDTETTVEYGDAPYDIPTATYQTAEIRLYLTGKYNELKNRISAIYKGINDTITDADSVSKVKQYIADHYGLAYGAGTTDDMMINRLIQHVEFYNTTITDEDKKYGFDWLFSYFVQQILIGGYWANIAAGQFNYTELTARPYDWLSSFSRREGYSQKYFQKSNDDPNIYVAVPIGNMPYYPGLYYTANAATRTLITSDTKPDDFHTCVYKNRFTLTTQEPDDWETNYSKYFVYHSDADYVVNVGASTTPTWEANKYYVEDHSGLFESYQQVTDCPAFFASELGTADNKIPIAPAWAEHTFFTESGGTYTEQTERPNDWFTNYTSYYRREGTEGEYTYYAVAAQMVKIRDHTDHYYSRELIPPSSNP